jgi:bud site selection protein 20
MGRLARSRKHRGIRDIKRKYRLRRRTKDLDQIHEDLEPEKATQYEQQEVDPDLPGLAQHYCIQCSKYFIDEKSLAEHRRGKYHKKRLRLLKDAPYTIKEAEMAAGLGTDNGKKLNAKKKAEKEEKVKDMETD